MIQTIEALLVRPRNSMVCLSSQSFINQGNDSDNREIAKRLSNLDILSHNPLLIKEMIQTKSEIATRVNIPADGTIKSQSFINQGNDSDVRIFDYNGYNRYDIKSQSFINQGNDSDDC